jgi:hypothetical protein
MFTTDFIGQNFPLIAGLDPAIQTTSQTLLQVMLDARVKPGHEGL